MSEVALVGATPLPSHDFARLRALSRELTAALAEFHDVTSREPGSPGARALARLVRGEGRPQDEVLLGIHVPHSRLIWLSVPSENQADRLVDELGADGRIIALNHSPAEVVLLVPAKAVGDSSSRSKTAAARVARRASSLVKTASIGISSPLETVHDLPSALVEARKVAHAESEPAFADERWADLGVASLIDRLAECLTVGNPLRVLARNGVLAESVTAWLQHGRNVPAAAEELGLHPNTLRYRLNRVPAVTGLDLTDANAVLLAELLLCQGRRRGPAPSPHERFVREH